jgi:hypothetical protein
VLHLYRLKVIVNKVFIVEQCNNLRLNDAENRLSRGKILMSRFDVLLWLRFIQYSEMIKE